MRRFENIKIGRRLQASSFKQIGNSKQLAACSLKLVAVNQGNGNNFKSSE